MGQGGRRSGTVVSENGLIALDSNYRDFLSMVEEYFTQRLSFHPSEG